MRVERNRLWRKTATGGGRLASGVGCLEGGEVAGGAAELDADQVNGLVSGAVLGGVAVLLELGERGSRRRHLGDLELEQVDVAGGAYRHVQAPVAAPALRAISADLWALGALEAVDRIQAQADSGVAIDMGASSGCWAADIVVRNNRRLQTVRRSLRLAAVKTLAEFDCSSSRASNASRSRACANSASWTGCCIPCRFADGFPDYF